MKHTSGITGGAHEKCRLSGPPRPADAESLLLNEAPGGGGPTLCSRKPCCPTHGEGLTPRSLFSLVPGTAGTREAAQGPQEPQLEVPSRPLGQSTRGTPKEPPLLECHPASPAGTRPYFYKGTRGAFSHIWQRGRWVAVMDPHFTEGETEAQRVTGLPALHPGEWAEPGLEPKTLTLRPLCSVVPQ